MSRLVTIVFPNGKKKTQKVPQAEAWNAIIDLIYPEIKPGSIVTLSGPLGAGKTTCVQHLAKTLGGKKLIQSPTFALMRVIPVADNRHGIKRLIHVDAYRIEHDEELRVLDLDEEVTDGKSICVLEWPENVQSWIQKNQTRCIAIYIKV
ncbi:tRNA (adenosine(37)-N6)-threonylcarbamoyltransferase complex ATPase subunit type 1 TsaE [Candidatus Uhrbacteria bacterium]|nr:tRNA (adenosine(37)-N6)-threonylcarbamoyltransferase complex ATPase subunit type 1 TsaE [Candidatus Uhrbacteria bacterium]